jgi:hypothetical protein
LLGTVGQRYEESVCDRKLKRAGTARSVVVFCWLLFAGGGLAYDGQYELTACLASLDARIDLFGQRVRSLSVMSLTDNRIRRDNAVNCHSVCDWSRLP